MAVRMEVSRILIRENDEYYIVELREAGGSRVFPILIGLTEAAAIERRIMGQQPPRPQTHELLANIIEAMGGAIEKVVINDLKHDKVGHGTFFARLFIRRGDEVLDIDSRPSDAIALGVATDVPIFVEDHVLDELPKGE